MLIFYSCEKCPDYSQDRNNIIQERDRQLEQLEINYNNQINSGNISPEQALRIYNLYIEEKEKRTEYYNDKLYDLATKCNK